MPGTSRAPHRPATTVTLRAMITAKELQENPLLGEFRIHAALKRLGIFLSPRTCGRILAPNRTLDGLPKPAPHRIFSSTRFGRVLDWAGYARFRRWRVSAERGLGGEPVAVRLYAAHPTLVDRDEPLAQYRVADQPDQRRPQMVTPEQLFETPHRSPQPPLWPWGRTSGDRCCGCRPMRRARRARLAQCNRPSSPSRRSAPKPSRERPPRLALPRLTAHMCQACRLSRTSGERPARTPRAWGRPTVASPTARRPHQERGRASMSWRGVLGALGGAGLAAVAGAPTVAAQVATPVAGATARCEVAFVATVRQGPSAGTAYRGRGSSGTTRGWPSSGRRTAE